MKSSTNQIQTKISKSLFGEIFFMDDFVRYGSAENIRKVFSRLEEAGVVMRIAHGIFSYCKNVKCKQAFISLLETKVHRF